MQRADGRFLTDYAAAYPDREDVAETALFVWTLTAHPDRLPPDVVAAVRTQIPNRLEYLTNMLSDWPAPAAPPPAPCPPS